jgi:hypothetical protein
MADQQQQQQQPRVKISGLWTNTTKTGQEYWSGSNGSVRYSIWPNGFATGPNDPSHVLYVEQVVKKADDTDLI